MNEKHYRFETFTEFCLRKGWYSVKDDRFLFIFYWYFWWLLPILNITNYIDYLLNRTIIEVEP